MSREIKINSLKELVGYAVKEQGKERYFLRSYSSSVYIDQEAGTKWEDERFNLSYVGLNDPRRPEYDAKLEKLRECQPEQKQITQFWLTTGEERWSEKLLLSEELAQQIDAIWTKRPWYRGSKELRNSGTLTLPGILKRLGNTDVSKQIKAALVAAQKQIEKNNRNFTRRKIKEQAFNLRTLLEANMELIAECSIDNINLALLLKLQNLKEEE